LFAFFEDFGGDFVLKTENDPFLLLLLWSKLQIKKFNPEPKNQFAES
jgi:hypothetical protein